MKYNINYLLLIIVPFFGCSVNNMPPKPNSLECILESFILSVDDVDNILITDHKGWTEKSSIIRILKINRNDLENGKILHSSYRNVDVFYEYGELVGDSIKFINDTTLFSLPSTLTWEFTEMNNSKKDIVSFGDPVELQISYNFESKCIIDVKIGSEDVINNLYNCSQCY